jgi:endoglucanase
MKGFNFLIFLLPAFALLGCKSTGGKQEWDINEHEYLETPGFNVLVFNDYYPEGNQGGIEFIHHDNRTAANGFINVDLEGGKRFPAPLKAKRIVDRQKNEISALVTTPKYNFNYTIRIWPENGSVHLVVDLDKPIPAEWEGKATFDLKLFPVPMATGSRLVLASEDPLCKLEIVQAKGELSLIDDRNSSLGGWIKVQSVIPSGIDKGAMEWVITPNLISGWYRTPVISLSQVGYHPAQPKKSIIELDARTENIETAILKRIGVDGTIREVKSGQPEEWGKFLRYKYAVFDFTDIKEHGIYTVVYGNLFSEPFRISNDVYQRHVWQPTLEIYFAVQMYHMRIRDCSRVWLGACHLDDAVQAPVNTIHVDGYKTNATT